MLWNNIVVILLTAAAAAASFFTQPGHTNAFPLAVLVSAAVCCVLNIAVFGFGLAMLPVYIACLLAGLMFLFGGHNGPRTAVCVLAALLLCVSSFISPLARLGTHIFYDKTIDASFADYAETGYVSSFKKLCEHMRTTYPFASLKAIDFDALCQKFLPEFEKAQTDGSRDEYYAALRHYAHAFNDEHIGANPIFGSDAYNERFLKNYSGNDYGLSLITYTDGRTAAILVEDGSEAAAAGIHTGTIIRKWNGTDIDKAKAAASTENLPLRGFPVSANEDMYKAFVVAGTGKDSVTVTFSNDSGKESKAVLHSRGSYASRLSRAIDLFSHSDSTANFSWKILSSGIGYLRINSENEKGASDGFAQIKKDLRAMAGKMSAAKVTDLMIDMRGNIGGDDRLGAAVVGLFADRDFTYKVETRYDRKTGAFIPQKNGTVSVKAENIWSGRKITILINSRDVSAGEGMLYNFSKLPNVTVVGTSATAGVFADSWNNVLLPGNILFTYPSNPIVNADGEVMIDNGADRLAFRNPDTVIPIDEAYIKAVFDEKKDYELDYAAGLAF